jgi:3-(3-hydroxy-phenyl)propionate hydroxylase
MSSVFPLPSKTPVLIAGGGPVGLCLAAILARYGIDTLTIEADEAYCVGSRAICMSRRSQEILGWVGAHAPLVEKGLPWVAGRSFFRDEEVLSFDMPHDPAQRFAPMVNIQQYYVEQFAHEAMQACGDRAQVAWNTRVVGIQNHEAGARVQVEAGETTQWIDAQWVIACDGGRSTVREAMGLQLQGVQYDGRYVIVDIEQVTQRPVERLAWFDPPSNPGSTILMHRQPDNVWRIDYQVSDDEDPAEAVKPENVLPRVQSHLDMIGETEPWKPLWISIYNAKCLTLESYRHGHVLFAGDAAHLVPIFGVRGLNSGLDDAANLGWKLAWVLRGAAQEKLLDTYSVERVHATRQNLAYGSKSTEFMAPPNFGFSLMRDAVLRLAIADPSVRSLINPRQSSPVSYDGSALNLPDGFATGPITGAPGQPMPELMLQRGDEIRYLTQWFGQGFVVLAIDLDSSTMEQLAHLCEQMPIVDGVSAVKILHVGSEADARSACAKWHALHDGLHSFSREQGLIYLLRPDAYILGRWPTRNSFGTSVALEHIGRALRAFHPL